MEHYNEYNANPNGRRVGDCVVRAISKALDRCWERVYSELSVRGLMMGDMPSANSVWGEYLYDNGFIREPIPSTCPVCYTVEKFCQDNPKGTYVLALDGHAVAVVDGVYYDSWDSGNQTVLFAWHKIEGSDE